MGKSTISMAMFHVGAELSRGGACRVPSVPSSVPTPRCFRIEHCSQSAIYCMCISTYVHIYMYMYMYICILYIIYIYTLMGVILYIYMIVYGFIHVYPICNWVARCDNNGYQLPTRMKIWLLHKLWTSVIAWAGNNSWCCLWPKQCSLQNTGGLHIITRIYDPLIILHSYGKSCLIGKSSN